MNACKKHRTKSRDIKVHKRDKERKQLRKIQIKVRKKRPKEDIKM